MEYPELDLLAAFKARFGISERSSSDPPDTEVLKSAEFIYNNAIDVSISMAGTQSAAETLATAMQEQSWSTSKWREHELHPRVEDLGSEEAVLNFIFTMDLLNFSFWDDGVDGSSSFEIEYRDSKWTGYWAMVAALRKALDNEIPVTDSHWWQSEDCNLEALQDVFKSPNGSSIPLLDQRLHVLKEAGDVLYHTFDCRVANCIKKADRSASGLANLLAKRFPSFRDQTRWEDEKVRFLKRAQIFVADVWACFDGQGYGNFEDIGTITAFADYRIPQMLYAMNVLSYSPPLESCIRQRKTIEPGHNWEVELRGCSVWAVELIKRHIGKSHPELNVNAILIDFFLYDAVKQQQQSADEVIPHHRTRSIWY